MKKLFLIVVAVMLASMSAMAQIPANILEVLKKCDEKMDNPAGMVVDMMVKTKILVISVNGTAKMYQKGDKYFSEMIVKAAGHEMRTEQGFDGQQVWDYTTAAKKSEKDTLTITKTSKAKNNDCNIDFDFEKMYKSAKMKEKGLYYVISFSDRIDPEAPKKMSVKIAKSNYNMREVSFSAGPAKITLTVTKITIGARDSMFKLDMNRYKNAVVVRK